MTVAQQPMMTVAAQPANLATSPQLTNLASAIANPAATHALSGISPLLTGGLGMGMYGLGMDPYSAFGGAMGGVGGYGPMGTASMMNPSKFIYIVHYLPLEWMSVF